MTPVVSLASLTAFALIAVASPLHAQSIEPYDLLPHPAGSSMLEGSVQFDRYDGFKFTDAGRIPGSSYDAYSGSLRYEYYLTLAGQPAALQIFQGASLFDTLRFGGLAYHGSGLGSPQANDTVLSAEFWPYANAATGTQLYSAVYLDLPDGSYSKSNSFNAGAGAVGGSIQLGAFQTVSTHVSAEATIDAGFLGDRRQFGATASSTPTYELQLWGNYAWDNGLTTSLGYAGGWGGIRSVDGYRIGRESDYQRLRLDVGYWWTQRLETDVQIAHDLDWNGGYRLGIGSVARVRYLF